MSEQTAGLEEEAADDVPDTEEVESQEAETEDQEDLEAQSDEEGDDEEEEAPEVDEFDFGGNRLELPKGSVPDELKARIDEFTKGTWGDYTRKSQEVAERSKTLEAREKAVEKFSSLNDEALQSFSKGLALKSELEQLQGYDLQSMWQSDPDRARQISDVISRKQAEFQNALTDVSQKEQQLTQAQQAELARRSEEGRSQVERRVKGFNADAVKDYVLKNYGEMGITAQDADNWGLTPATAIMAHKAMLFDQMQAKAKKPAPKKKEPAEPVKPMKAKGRTNRPFDPVRDAEKLSMEEWARRERARLAKKRNP